MAEGFTFSSFGFAKRGESNKEEKSDQRGISIFPLWTPLLKTTTQGAAAPYVENPGVWGYATGSNKAALMPLLQEGCPSEARTGWFYIHAGGGKVAADAAD